MKKALTVFIGILVICGVSGATALAGNYDQSVYNAQRQLKDQGYSPGSADGLMGKKTSEAIRKFQQDQGLPATGTLDEKTERVLTGQPSSGKNAQPNTAPEPSKNTGKASATSAGNGPRVLKAQQYLQQLGYSPGPADGLEGKKTTAAVKKFQQDRGLTVTGIINDLIIQKLESLLGSQEKPKDQTAYEKQDRPGGQDGPGGQDSSGGQDRPGGQDGPGGQGPKDRR